MFKRAFLLIFLAISACSPANQPPTIPSNLEFDPTITLDTPEVEQIDYTDLNNWEVITESSAVKILREGEIFNYVFVIDATKADITVRHDEEDYTFMDILLRDKDPDADCGFAGPNYSYSGTDFYPIEYDFPLIEDGQLIPGTNPLSGTVKTLYIDGSRVWMSDTTSDTIQSSQYAISGLSPLDFETVKKSDDLYLQLVAVKDNLLLVTATFYKSPEEISRLLQTYGVAPENIMVMSTHPQAGCFAKQYYQWNLMTYSAIFVTEK